MRHAILYAGTRDRQSWIPAFAGMTNIKNDYLNTVTPAEAGVQLHFTVPNQSNNLSNPPTG